MDNLPIRKLYISGGFIKVSRNTMPKPKGSIGATKMKIMAVICYNGECGRYSYGYQVWQALKNNFYIYINEGDVRNVYHHLKGLCALDLIERIHMSESEASERCLYRLTEKGQNLRSRYHPFLEILHRSSDPLDDH